jgi:hypothetical protein
MKQTTNINFLSARSAGERPVTLNEVTITPCYCSKIKLFFSIYSWLTSLEVISDAKPANDCSALLEAEYKPFF